MMLTCTHLFTIGREEMVALFKNALLPFAYTAEDFDPIGMNTNSIGVGFVY
jgi:hypothetical protein